MTGLVNRHTNLPLQLKASSIFAEVNGFAARVLATLTYYNDCDYDIEGLFVFPQDERTTVVEFEATIEERHVYSDIRDQNGLEAVEKSLYSVEEREDELFSISMGRIPAHSSVFVQVSLITELVSDQQTGGSLFVLPSVFTPRLTSEEDELLKSTDRYGSQILITDMPRKTFEPYSFELQLEVAGPCLLAGCSSRTHTIQVDADSKATNASRIHITMVEPHTYDCELEVLLHLSHPFDPYVLIEEGTRSLEEIDSPALKKSEATSTDLIENFAQKAAIMINYPPLLKASNAVSEYIFLVDRSGSMSGKHIFQVKETLILFLKSLPTNCYFNLIGFGSYYRSLYQESQPYTEATAEKACNYIQKMRADLGGSNLILPLEFIFQQPKKKGIPQFVFMLTDGGVSNTLEVVDYVRRNANSTRFYTFGIGPEACPHLIQGVAGAGKGKAWFIGEDERVPPKVMQSLNEAMQPAVTDLEVTWYLPEGYDVIQTPRNPPFVLNGERMVIYGILSRPPWEEKESPKSPSRRRMDLSMRSFSTNSVKVFWFDDDLEYLPEEQLLLELDEHDRLNEDVPENDSPFVGNMMPSQESFDVFESEEKDIKPSTEEMNDAPIKYTPVPDTSGFLTSLSREQNLPLSPIMDRADVVHNVVFGDFFSGLDFSKQGTMVEIESYSDLNEPLDQPKVNHLSEPLNLTDASIEIQKCRETNELEDENCNKTAIQDTRKAFQHKGKLSTQQRVEGSPEKKYACGDKETTDQDTSRIHERDSGVGFSMDEGDKGNSDETLPLKNLSCDVKDSKWRPPIEGKTPTEETIEIFDDSNVNVHKNSPFLAQLGLPKNFGAVSIKGFAGDEEIEQVIPFPVHHSGGSSKRPTIHQLLARLLIRELQASQDNKEECMRKIHTISKQAMVHCRLTAFVSIDQYCYEDEILSALQFPNKEETPGIGKRRVLSLERKCGFTTGLGRRLPSPEGSDQEAQIESTDVSPGKDEEPVDLYRLERTGTPESSEGSPKKITNSYAPPTLQLQQVCPQVPPLSTRYVVGEKQTSIEQNIKSSISERRSPILIKSLKEYKTFVRLANLQSSYGNWELDERFADCLGLTLDSIQQASPLADSTVCVSEDLVELMNIDKCDYSTQLWATSMGLAWLCRSSRQFQDEWFLLARKADAWLELRPCPRGFTQGDLKTLAYQALLLMQKKDSSGSDSSESPWEKVGDFEWPVF